MSPIGSSHAAIVNKLANLFYGLFKNRAVIGIQNPIRIDGNNEPEPDIALLKYRSDYYASAHPAPADVLAIIEVAGSSVRFEKEVKSPLYAAHGIPEYWIIDLDSDRIEVFSNPKGGAYAEPEVYRSGDEVTLMGSKLFVNDLII
jgi:Uma2 family endonuclease